MIADASGRAIGFALAPGQAHELPLAPLLLTLLSAIPAELCWNLGDGLIRRRSALACR